MKQILAVLLFFLIVQDAEAQLNILVRGEQPTELAPHGGGNCYAPSILIAGNKWRLWYGAQGNDGHDRIHYAESDNAGRTWTKLGVALDCGTANHVNDPSIVKANGAYFMFYTVAQEGIEDAIALAVSDDGRHWQKRGVVLAPGKKGQWDSRFVGRPAVLHENGIFKMWFDGKPTEEDAPAAKLEGARAVGYATSPDGEHWTRFAGNPVFQKGAGAVDVARTETGYVLLYEGHNGTSIARSADGIVWQDAGLLSPLTGAESDRFGHVTPHLVQVGDKWRLFVGAAARQSWDGNAIAEVKIENLSRSITESSTARKSSMQNFDFQKSIEPLPLTAKFSDPDYYIWCGSGVKGDDGKYHLFYSRWLKKLGFSAWVTHSEIAHAVSDSPFGPYKHVDVTLPTRGKEFWDGLCTHNPTIHRFGNKYYLYYMGNTGDGVNMKTLNWTHRNNQRIGVAVADKPEGPWTRFDKPVIAPTPGFYDALCCANPSVTARPEGGYLMIYKAVGDKNPLPFGGPVLHCVATSDSPIGPFEKYPDPVFVKEGVAFAAEDPFIWTQGGHYFAIVKDNAGHFTNAGKSLALFQSADGFHWELAAHPLVSKIEVTWQDGRVQKLNSLERPQLLIENGVPVALYCAADEDNKREFSYNLQIPLAP